MTSNERLYGSIRAVSEQTERPTDIWQAAFISIAMSAQCSDELSSLSAYDVRHEYGDESLYDTVM